VWVVNIKESTFEKLKGQNFCYSATIYIIWRFPLQQSNLYV